MRRATLIALLPLALPAALAMPPERIGPAWTDVRNPIVKVFGGKRLDLWSLRPLSNTPPPAVPGVPDANPIDAFLGTAKAPLADNRTLARRLSFDLTGLPPTVDDVASFPGAAAYAEKQLASKAYGEQMARLWLDVVRYSDSNGFDWDEFRPKAWRFRDYVIRSFNADKPYDRFVTEQLAGDELVPGPPKDAAEQDCLIATGYLRLGPWDNSAGLFGEAPRVRNALMNDLVETTGAAFLGLTMACSRCHNHKTEPIAQSDFYRMRAFFEPVAFRDDLPLDLAPVQARFDKEVAARTAKQKDDPLPYAYGLVATDSDKAPAATHVLAGGDLTRPGDEVAPGFPSALDPNPVALPTVVRPKSTGRRSALARWIVAPDNPLAARVMVNRIWQQHFGEGLVATPNDFGYSGARPRHPELLDYLARRFQKDGWSIKRLHRLIVASHAYQRRDSGPPRRLSAEQLRDTVLAVSGKLRPWDGGPPIWPTLPDEVLKANPAFLDDNKEKTKGWYPSHETVQGVRSVYLVQKRTVAVPFLATFDLPDNAVSCARRLRSTVAPQALSLLNNPLLASASESFAARVIREAGPDPDRQTIQAFRLALQRRPSSDEKTLCRGLHDKHGLPALCRALLNLNEFVYVD